MHYEDDALAALQKAWDGRWSIWRAQRSEDPPETRNGDYVATRMDDTAGIWPTVIATTPALLDRALREQATQAAARAEQDAARQARALRF